MIDSVAARAWMCVEAVDAAVAAGRVQTGTGVAESII